MRVIWKDSIRSIENRRYRKYQMYREQQGWTVDIPGDNNIYAGVADACNAIDKILGEDTKLRKSISRGDRIKVIGKTNE